MGSAIDFLGCHTDNGDIREKIGHLGLKHWATRHARLPDEPTFPLHPPNTKTFRQCVDIDIQRRHINGIHRTDAREAEQKKRTLHLEINGVEVPVKLRVAELRQILGLPNMNIMRLGDFNDEVPQGPQEDMG